MEWSVCVFLCVSGCLSGCTTKQTLDLATIPHCLSMVTCHICTSSLMRYTGFCPLMSYLMPWKPIWETSHPTTLCRSDRNWLQVSEKSIVVTFSTWSHGFYPGLGIQIQHIIYYSMHRFSNMSTGKKIHPKKIRTDKPLSTCVCVIRPHKGAWWAGCVIRLPQGNSQTIHQAFREWWEKSIESF